MPVEMHNALSAAVMFAAFATEHGSLSALSRFVTCGAASSPTFGARAARCFITRTRSWSIGFQLIPYL
jgi:hypothetical protein